MQQVFSPYQQYQKQKDHDVRSASPVKLIGMLLEGAILFNKRAIASIEEKRRVNALEQADRACKIVLHLYNCLDFDRGGEISDKLASLYNYILDQYVRFAKGDVKVVTLEGVNRILDTILQGWKQVEGNPS